MDLGRYGECVLLRSEAGLMPACEASLWIRDLGILHSFLQYSTLLKVMEFR